jgi:hypothetical protein
MLRASLCTESAMLLKRYYLNQKDHEALRDLLERYDIIEASEEIRTYVAQEMPELLDKLPPVPSRTVH